MGRYLAIPAKAPHAAAAHEFIDYVLEPEVGAEIVKTVGYASANLAARKFIAPEILNDANIYAPEEVLNRCEIMDDIGKSAQLVDKLWTRLKAK